MLRASFTESWSMDTDLSCRLSLGGPCTPDTFGLEESEFVETEGLNHSLYDIQVNEKIVKFLDQ